MSLHLMMSRLTACTVSGDGFGGKMAPSLSDPALCRCTAHYRTSRNMRTVAELFETVFNPNRIQETESLKVPRSLNITKQ